MAAQVDLPIASQMEVRKPSTMDLLQVALQNNAAIDVIERLAALQEKAIAKEAEQDFFQDLHAAQQEVPSIEPNKEVRTGSNKLMYKYASYEQLDKALRPIYIKHGMAISFSGGEAPEGKVRVLCCASHRSGHVERYQLDLAIDPGAAQLSKTDAELAAQSKAKRRILRNIFNIVDDLDDEGGMTQGWLTEQLEWLANAKDLDELQKLFTSAYKEAKQQRAVPAMQALIKAKDARKAELS